MAASDMRRCDPWQEMVFGGWRYLLERPKNGEDGRGLRKIYVKCQCGHLRNVEDSNGAE